jgi:hypothetical protein
MRIAQKHTFSEGHGDPKRLAGPFLFVQRRCRVFAVRYQSSWYLALLQDEPATLYLNFWNVLARFFRGPQSCPYELPLIRDTLLLKTKNKTTVAYCKMFGGEITPQASFSISMLLSRPCLSADCSKSTIFKRSFQSPVVPSGIEFIEAQSLFHQKTRNYAPS